MTESDPATVGVKHDFESAFVDDHLMVKPTEDDEFTLVGATALGPEGQMMHLKPMSAGAAVGRTPESRLSEKHPLQGWWGRPGTSAVVHESSVGRPGYDFHVGVTQDYFEGITANPDARVENHSRFSRAFRRLPGINDHGDLAFGGIV